jgi:hypothetical protein
VRPAASGLRRRESRAIIEIFFLASFGSIFRDAASLKREASKFVLKSIAPARLLARKANDVFNLLLNDSTFLISRRIV